MDTPKTEDTTRRHRIESSRQYMNPNRLERTVQTRAIETVKGKEKGAGGGMKYDTHDADTLNNDVSVEKCEA
jgi:hypothetical protein